MTDIESALLRLKRSDLKRLSKMVKELLIETKPTREKSQWNIAVSKKYKEVQRETNARPSRALFKRAVQEASLEHEKAPTKPRKGRKKKKTSEDMDLADLLTTRKPKLKVHKN